MEKNAYQGNIVIAGHAHGPRFGLFCMLHSNVVQYKWKVIRSCLHDICQGVVKANQLHDVQGSMREATVVLRLHGRE